MVFKNPYCDFTAYKNGPFSHSLTEEEYNNWAVKASYLIDNLTHGRASVHAEALSAELAYACGQIAEIMKRNHAAMLAAAGGLAGASNDGYSESYTASGETSRNTDRICYAILEEALGNDPYGLLYAGVI